MKRLTRSQRRSLRGQVLWLDEHRLDWPQVKVLVYAHHTAILFMERCGLLEDCLGNIGTLNAEGRRAVVNLRTK